MNKCFYVDLVVGKSYSRSRLNLLRKPKEVLKLLLMKSFTFENILLLFTLIYKKSADTVLKINIH